LEREPDTAGWNYWTSELQRCGNVSKCLLEQRNKVAAAFFAEEEFQKTGFFIYRLYKAALGVPPTYQEFKSNRAKLVGSPDLKTAQRAFVESWVKRPQFTRLYPSGLTAAQLVDALVKNISATSGTSLDHQGQELIARFGNQATRARIVQSLAEDETFSHNEYNRALVYMQYFGYLKRDPDADGVSFWEDQISKKHVTDSYQIVGSFINSKEYRARFVRPAGQGNH